MTTRLLRRPAPPRLDSSEAAFQRLVVDLAQWLGYRVYHTHDSRRSKPGWPDLAIVGFGRLYLWELKTTTGRVSQAQAEWGAALVAADIAWRVVRPADWETIVSMLEEGAR